MSEQDEVLTPAQSDLFRAAELVGAAYRDAMYEYGLFKGAVAEIASMAEAELKKVLQDEPSRST
ncbi:hypothetical protein [Spirillospora albida]|uniref:hypothetical protein n=1 Tax=Spirillospora albida TaxID=58123 RepID=UPI0004C041A0|nr:hypothetical protein [Spirillospora albida]